MNVTAAFVTMNRSATAATCIERLLAQSRRPDKIIVVDNHSTDDTLPILEALKSRHPELLHIIPLAENLGNAGGMEIAFNTGFTSGAGFVWILDDDSWPEPDALRNLLAGKLPANAIRACRVVDLETGNLSWPLQLATDSGWKLLEQADPVPSEAAIRIRRAWLGALVPLEVYETVGNINGRMFLRGEDEDYPRRIEAAGFPVFMMTDSVLHHPAAGRLNRMAFLGREVVLEDGLSGDKLYYRLRNSWWMTKRDKGCLRMLVISILHFIVLSRAGGIHRSWAYDWFDAFRDATRNRLGQRTPQ